MDLWAKDGWSPRVDPVSLSAQTLDRLLPALVGLDVDYLRAVGPGAVPLLYESHVRYVPDRGGHERWATIPHVFERGAADCKSLAAWRCAELIVRGEPAICCLYVDANPKTGARVFHVCVLRADGSVEDPSFQLGMGWHEGYAIPKRSLLGSILRIGA